MSGQTDPGARFPEERENTLMSRIKVAQVDLEGKESRRSSFYVDPGLRIRRFITDR